MATFKEKKFLLDNFDYDGLVAMGFYNGIGRYEYDKQIKRICAFFELKNIFQYETMNAEQNKPIQPDLMMFSEN